LCATFSTVLDLDNPCLAEPRLAEPSLALPYQDYAVPSLGAPSRALPSHLGRQRRPVSYLMADLLRRGPRWCAAIWWRTCCGMHANRANGTTLRAGSGCGAGAGGAASGQIAFGLLEIIADGRIAIPQNPGFRPAPGFSKMS
jgi:hypothetical protein